LNLSPVDTEPAAATSGPPIDGARGVDGRRILIVIPNLLCGGAERVAALLSCTLGGEVYIALFNQLTQVQYPTGGTLIDLGLRPSTTTRGRIANLLRGAARLNRLKRTLDVAATVSFLDAPGILNTLTGTRDSRIVSARSVMSQTYRTGGIASWAYRLFLRWSFSRADLIVANSAGVARDLQLNFGVQSGRIRVIHNPCDVSGITEMAGQSIPAEHAAFFEHPVVATMGRLTADKAHWALVRSYAASRRRLPGLRLMVIGDGELRDDTVSRARALGLRVVAGADRGAESLRAADVWCLGLRQNPFSYVARSKAFVLSSVREGFPNALVEAMACGVPVVATDCQAGPREILAPSSDLDRECAGVERAQYGLLVPVPRQRISAATEPLSERERHLADAVVALCADPSLHHAYASAARARAADFRVERVIPQWEHALAQVSRYRVSVG